jgi:hypothetical protein
MAELPPLDMDSEPSPMLGKMDALIARHRGSGPDPSVPVLTDLASAAAPGNIPVLTEVAPVIGDDLMFTPEEIRADDSALAPPPARPSAPQPAPAPLAAQPAAAPAQAAQASARPAIPSPSQRPTGTPVVEDLIAVPPLAGARRDPATAPAQPAAAKSAQTAPTAPSGFEFPDLPIPSAVPKPKPAMTSAALPAMPGGQLMPELSLNFNFTEPADTPEPTAPAPVAAAATPATTAIAELADGDDHGLDLSIEAPAPDHIDIQTMIEEVSGSLYGPMEKLVRAELARQLAGMHVEALKRTIAALQPQLQQMVANEVEAAVKRRWE